MKKIKNTGIAYLFSISAILVTLLSAPFRLLADTGANTDQPTLTNTLKNPIGVDDLSTFVKKILDIVLTIGIPIVALAIIYSGFLFVSARGNSEKLTDAKKSLMYTLIGAAILLGAWILAQAIGDTVGELRKAV